MKANAPGGTPPIAARPTPPGIDTIPPRLFSSLPHHLGVRLSRGLGQVQRFILNELRALPAGYGVQLVDDSSSPIGSSSLRRAARSMESRGLVRLQYCLIDHRRRLVAYVRTEVG